VAGAHLFPVIFWAATGAYQGYQHLITAGIIALSPYDRRYWWWNKRR
jgi:hypothetical protein